MTFAAQPGNAQFKTNVLMEKGEFVTQSRFERLSKYGNQSACMTDKKYSGICYCKSLPLKKVNEFN